MRLEFLLEEQSAEKALQNLLPRLLPDQVSYYLHPHNGREDLLRQLGAKLRAYSRWLPADAYVVVLCDQHSRDCAKLKQVILNEATAIGFERILARIVVAELESWFLGDPAAIEAAFPRLHASGWAGRKTYRHPDRLLNASQVLDRLLRNAGYRERYPKVIGARRISEHMSLEDNRSHSFGVFCDGLRRICGTG